MKSWETLYDKASSGKIKFWKISVFELGRKGHAEIRIVHGYVGGKETTKLTLVDKGKNLGKVNSTTPMEQALADAESKWSKKKDKGYVSQLSQMGNKVCYLPMLAKTYYSKTSPDVVKGKKKETKVILPLIVQPKLNGVRAPVRKESGEVIITSRLGKDYTEVCAKLAKELSRCMQNTEIWDGEIYVHGWSFQRIVRAVKKDRLKSFHKDIKKAVRAFKRDKVDPDEIADLDEIRMIVRCKHDTQKLQFHRYDVCDEKIDMQTRMVYMRMLATSNFVKQVHTELVYLLKDIKDYHDIYVKQGYEGIIIRDPEAKYKFKYRGARLLKYKEFIDAEFNIDCYKYDVRQDTGPLGNIVQRKCIKYQCVTNNGITFEVVPQGSLIQRERWWNDRFNIDNAAKLTVRYQELSEDDVPMFPIGIGVRDYE